jgi:hypothetical protein
MENAPETSISEIRIILRIFNTIDQWGQCLRCPSGRTMLGEQSVPFAIRKRRAGVQID